MRHRRFYFTTLAFALSFSLVACGEQPPADPRTGVPLVRAAVVAPAIPAGRTFTGTVAAREQSDLGFRIPGKVIARLVDTGQAVKRGQVLARLDTTDLQLTEGAEQEKVKTAEASARQTAQEEARYRDLHGTGAISASAYDQVTAAARGAKAQLAAAQAQAQIAQNARRYAELIADADGVVMETLAEPGQVVAAGQPVMRLARAGDREAVIALPETLRPAIGSTAFATLFGHDDGVSPAKLRQLSDTADKLTRTFEARYVLAGEFGKAPLGATVSLRIPDDVKSVSGGWTVPIGALFDAGKGPGVWLIDGQPATVRWQPVTVQRLGDDQAQVTGSFRQGDRIVALGAHLLREGAPVRIADQAATPAAAVGTRP